MKYKVNYSLILWSWTKGYTKRFCKIVEAKSHNEAVRAVLIETNGSAFNFLIQNYPPDVKIGDKVSVSFISESRTEFSNQKFEGVGVVDRAEDGYVFGTTEDGRHFMCNQEDVEIIEEGK